MVCALSLLKYTLPLDIGLPSIHAMPQIKQPTMHLENVLSVVMIFHIALFLIKKLTSNQKKCSNKSMHKEFSGHKMFPTILKQLIDRMVDRPLKDSTT